MVCNYCKKDNIEDGLYKGKSCCWECYKSGKAEMMDWFLIFLTLDKQIKIIKPHYEKWYNDQQIELERVRGDI